MPKEHPPNEMIQDLTELFKKHDWHGGPIGIKDANGAADECPPGTSPKQVTYQLPDGTWVTKTICV